MIAPEPVEQRTASQRASQHHLALDGLRGWAALAVVLYHCILHYSPDLTAIMVRGPGELTTLREVLAWLALNVANGSFAVTLFFILSGLVLAESLQRQAADHPFGLAVSFAVRRTLRLMPPVIACLLFTYAVGNGLAALELATDRRSTLFDLWDNLLLLRFPINGATWTIQVEMLIVPFMLGVFFLQRLLGPIVSILAVIAAIHVVPLTTLFGQLTYLNDALLAFSLGMLLGQPWARQAFASRHRFMPWLLLLAFLLSRPLLGWGSHAAVVTQILLGAALIGHLASSPSSLADLLSGRVSQFLGKISYSFYLFNVPVIWIVGAALPFAVPNGSPLETGTILSSSLRS